MEEINVTTIREEIDRLDYEILQLLAKRREQCRIMGEYKRQHGLTVRDETREQKILEKLSKMAKSAGLDAQTACEIYRVIIADSVTLQEEIVKGA